MEEKNKNFLNIGLVLFIVNALFWIFTLINTYHPKLSYYISGSNIGLSIFMLLFEIPIFIMLYASDFISLIMMFIYKKIQNKIFLIVPILLSIYGSLIMKAFISQDINNSTVTSVYYIFKVVLIVYNIYLLMKSKKNNTN